MLASLNKGATDDDYNWRYDIHAAPTILSAFQNKIDVDPTAAHILSEIIKKKAGEIRAGAQKKLVELVALKEHYEKQS